MPSAAHDTPAAASHGLGDFRADPRLLVLAAMALVVGAGGALSAWGLLKLIGLVSNLIWFGRFQTDAIPLGEATRTPWMVAAPVLGGLVIGLMARFGSEKIRGHGIPEAIEAILIGESRMSPKVALLKPLSSAISIGSGGPFGAEGPIIMTGGALGSLFAQFFHLTAAERKTLLVAGAAAGMTGIFGTPLAAVLLAVELLLFEWRPRSFIPVVTAVASAFCLRPFLLGTGPLFPFTKVVVLPWWGLIAAVGMGLLAGLQSGILTKCLYKLEDSFERLPIHWMWWPALGGVFVGLGGLIEPRALGVGYDVIAGLINDKFLVGAVVAILLVKAGIWLVALASGTSGGVLAPLLILGGALGWLVGLALPGAPGFWALLGMSAMLGGTMRSPLTGAIFAVELTGDMRNLPALLVASTAAYAVTVLMLKRSILTEKIARRGGHVIREYSIDPLELKRVSEVMVREVETISADLSIAQAVEVLQDGRHRIYPVVDAAGRPVGLVSRGDALRWVTEGGHANERLGDHVSDGSLARTCADEVVARAVELMITADQGRLPVVDRKTGALVGLVTRRDLLKVRAELARSEGERSAYFPAPRRRPGFRPAAE